MKIKYICALMLISMFSITTVYASDSVTKKDGSVVTDTSNNDDSVKSDGDIKKDGSKVGSSASSNDDRTKSDGDIKRDGSKVGSSSSKNDGKNKSGSSTSSKSGLKPKVSKQAAFDSSSKDLQKAGISKKMSRMMVKVTNNQKKALATIKSKYKSGNKKLGPVMKHILAVYGVNLVLHAAREAGLDENTLGVIKQINEFTNSEAADAVNCASALGNTAAMYGALGSCATGVGCAAVAAQFGKQAMLDVKVCSAARTLDHLLDNVDDMASAAKVPVANIMSQCTSHVLQNMHETLANSVGKAAFDSCLVYFEMAGEYIAEGGKIAYQGMKDGARLALDEGLKPAFAATKEAAEKAQKAVSYATAEAKEALEGVFTEENMVELAKNMGDAAEHVTDAIDQTEKHILDSAEKLKGHAEKVYDFLEQGTVAAVEKALDYTEDLANQAVKHAEKLAGAAKAAAKQAEAVANAGSKLAREAAIKTAMKAANAAKLAAHQAQAAAQAVAATADILKNHASKLAESGANKAADAAQDAAKASVAAAESVAEVTVNIANAAAEAAEQAAKLAEQAASKVEDALHTAAEEAAKAASHLYDNPVVDWVSSWF